MSNGVTHTITGSYFVGEGFLGNELNYYGLHGCIEVCYEIDPLQAVNTNGINPAFEIDSINLLPYISDDDYDVCLDVGSTTFSIMLLSSNQDVCTNTIGWNNDNAGDRDRILEAIQSIYEINCEILEAVNFDSVLLLSIKPDTNISFRFYAKNKFTGEVVEIEHIEPQEDTKLDVKDNLGIDIHVECEDDKMTYKVPVAVDIEPVNCVSVQSATACKDISAFFKACFGKEENKLPTIEAPVLRFCTCDVFFDIGNTISSTSIAAFSFTEFTIDGVSILGTDAPTLLGTVDVMLWNGVPKQFAVINYFNSVGNGFSASPTNGVSNYGNKGMFISLTCPKNGTWSIKLFNGLDQEFHYSMQDGEITLTAKILPDIDITPQLASFYGNLVKNCVEVEGLTMLEFDLPTAPQLTIEEEEEYEQIKAQRRFETLEEYPKYLQDSVKEDVADMISNDPEIKEIWLSGSWVDGSWYMPETDKRLKELRVTKRRGMKLRKDTSDRDYIVVGATKRFKKEGVDTYGYLSHSNRKILVYKKEI